MTVETNVAANAVKQNSERDAWLKPAIETFDAVSATQANTNNPGDSFDSNS